MSLKPLKFKGFSGTPSKRHGAQQLPWVEHSVLTRYNREMHQIKSTALTLYLCRFSYLPLVALTTSLLWASGCATSGFVAPADGGRADLNQMTGSADGGTSGTPELAASSFGDRPDSGDESASYSESDGDEIANDDANTPDVTEEELVPEEFGEGFCKDDLYSQFLMKKFPEVRSHKSGGKVARQTHFSARKAEAERLHFARSRLVGEMVPYFGAMPVVANARVEYWMRYFRMEGRNEFLKWLVRGESLKDVVQPLLRTEGLPPELFFLAMIESGFSNVARSKAKATGPWQFMGGTAKLYGLQINYWVDERRDPIKSTIAAARYMRDLYAEFGDWYLAMAAYNAGPGKVKRGIARTGSRDFWIISDTKHLRPETKHYVPKVLGALILASDPPANGFEIVPNPSDLPPSASVVVKRPVKLDDVARQLGISSQLLRKWNPELIHGVTPPRPGAKGYAIRMEKRLADKFAEIESKIPEIEVSDVKMHKVEHGETLSKIARRYNVGIKQIISINPDIRATSLRVGRTIAVPVPSVIEHSLSKPAQG